MTTSLHPIRARAGRRTWAVPAAVRPAALPADRRAAERRPTAVALSAWGWTPLDHHGVPWPSSLALLPGGWLQTVAFVGTGAALVALAAALPRGVRAFALGACGVGLVAAGFPLDLPLGDPASLASWIRSWPAVVHAGGFAVAGLAGLVAVAASRRRGDVAFAARVAARRRRWAGRRAGTSSWSACSAG